VAVAAVVQETAAVVVLVVIYVPCLVSPAVALQHD
jgi:hypothetical protein